MSEMTPHVLELNNSGNTWIPPEIDMEKAVSEALEAATSGRYLHIMRTDPYIDSVYIEYDPEGKITDIKRFTFHEGYSWDDGEERFFDEYCIKDDACAYSGGSISEIYKRYSAIHPEWHIQRYYTKGLRILDHIYNCLKQNTAKEMLYKAGLDELAVHIDEIDELNLLSDKPSDIYDGLSMKVLRSLNCPYGSTLLNRKETRAFLKKMNGKFPDIFSNKLNEAQCRYLMYLIEGDLTVGEAGRLFNSRRSYLSGIWSTGYMLQYIQLEKQNEDLKEICRIDPIYKDYIKSNKGKPEGQMIRLVKTLLLHRRREYDAAIRRANRKRDEDWQERGDEYIVRFPQTTNDFCREAVYMQNCLLTYIEPMIAGDTTILFMRKADDVNRPFITIEIFNGELMQAYHRFNRDCTPEEAKWITKYCKRHNIITGSFKFDADVDELF